MAGKKPRGRGVLAGFLRMTSDQAGENGASTATATAARLAPGALGEPEQTGPVSPQVRESYEPGWYRISVAQTSDDDEYVEDPAAGALARMHPVETAPEEPQSLEFEEPEVDPPPDEMPSF